MALLRRYTEDRPWRHLYGRKAWKKLRAAQLLAEPLCVFCAALECITAASVVDHRTPHKGDETLFFDSDNLQSLCKACHDSSKASEEARGFTGECDLNGYPIDPRHPVNKARKPSA